ncbi:hypothetical protein [Haloprofundus salinisoli]|uniref:hypothetical protein n=1 Tax=Haloprofundus salinisoli TaxID=2876193 RepID=UPI001CCADE63|nr:hypothetical protein [Haloprofundus salinisoli]
MDTESDVVSGTTDSFGTFVVLEESEWAKQFEDPLPSNWSVTEDFSEPDDWACEGENDPTCDTSGEGVTVGKEISKTASVKGVEKNGGEEIGILCYPTEYGCIPPTDSDNDGRIDFFDDCPSTPGTNNGCPQDSDGDGVDDIDDDCPNEAGSGPNGCPTGGYDPTPPGDDPGADDPNEPIDEGQQATNSTFGRSLTFRDAEEIVVEVEVTGEATGDRSQAMFILVDEDTHVTRFFNVEGKGDDGTQRDSQTVRRDLSQYAGETVAFRLVALNDSQVTLRSMRISYDSDGDGLSDSVEEAEIRTGYRGTVKTDPYSADTDGDGLTDGEEVGARSLYDYGRYFRIESDPTMADTDGDGLDNYEESNGETKVVTTTSKDDSIGLLQANAADQADYLNQYSSKSDPLYADTDFDGFDDLDELLSSTDPAKYDTDRDGILDGRERQLEGDPTLHDFRPPEVSVRYASFRKPAFSSKTHYRIIYTVEDASGVKRTAVVKGDTERYHQSFSDYPPSTTEDAQFTTKFFETSLDSLTGTTVFITAEDRHDNEIREIGYQRANFYGSVAGELDEDSIFTPVVAGQIGQLSGFAASLGSTGKDAHEAVTGFIEDPFGFVDGIKQLIALLDEAGVLEQLIESFAQEFEQKQQANNPYTPGTALYEEYRYNWYAGYVAAEISKIALGGSAAKSAKQAAKSTKQYNKVKEFVGKSERTAVLRKLNGRVDAGKVRVVSHAPGVSDEAKKVMASADSVGSAYRIWRLERKYDIIGGQDLNDNQASNLANYLSSRDAEGAKFVAKFDDNTLDYLLHQDDLDVAEQLSDVGVSDSRIRYLTEEGIDIRNHNRMVNTVLKLRHERSLNDEDKIAEALANEKIRQVYPQSYTIKAEVSIRGGGNELAEIDSVVLDENGRVVAFGETKNSIKKDKYIGKGLEQQRNVLDLVYNRRDEVDKISTAGGGELSLSQMPKENTYDTFTTGPIGAQYYADYTFGATKREVSEVFETYSKIT